MNDSNAKAPWQATRPVRAKCLPRMTPLDLVLLCALAGLLAAFFVHGGQTSPRPGQWEVLRHYLVRSDGRPGLLLDGLATTLRLTCWASIFALFFGLLAGMARTSRHLYPRLLGGTFVGICRNLPPLVLLFLCYFFLADQFIPSLGLQDAMRHAPGWLTAVIPLLVGPPAQMDAFLTAALTLGLYEGAYVAEIVRAGIQGVHLGQWEAARALGFPRWLQLRLIILPQAARNAIPPFAGQLISTIKDSAIVSVISIQELTFQGTQIMATTYLALEVWTCVALLYFVLTFSCSLAASRLERHMQRLASH